MRRALHILAVSLITAGLVILVDVGITIAWEEPISAAYSRIQQAGAEEELQEASARFAELLDAQRTRGGAGGGRGGPPTASAEAIERKAQRLADLFERRLRSGRPIGTIVAETFGVDQVFSEGDDPATLRKGPGHYPDTALPGQGKTIGIAGHRTTYGAPFRHIDRAERGDEIVLRTPYGSFTYAVQKTEIVEPAQVSVVDDVGYERLVLTACHPVYSAAERYVVFAKLSAIELPNGQSAEAPSP